MDIAKKCKEVLIEYDNIIFAHMNRRYMQNNLKAHSDIDVAIFLEKELN